MNDLIKRYLPRWLYLNEFMDALPGSNLDEKKEAVIMLLRDRMVVDGKLDETHFRFLGGKPQIENAYWLLNLSMEDIAWSDSSFRAGTAEEDPYGKKFYVIEIATAGLSLFDVSRGQKRARPTRTPPEQTRALRILHELYGESFPDRGKITDGELHRAVNAALEKGERSLGKDTVLRAAGRRK